MAVIEALMALFIKEQVTADRVVTTIKRFENLKSNSDSAKDNDIPKPSDQGEALLLWVTRSGELLRQRIIEELGDSGEAAQVIYRIEIKLTCSNIIKVCLDLHTIIILKSSYP